jgi:hypothetical protein
MKLGFLPILVDDDIDTAVRQGAKAVGLKLAASASTEPVAP